MPHRYTDVDRMILSRWTEVVGLRDAFDELLGRMRDVLGDTLSKVAAQASERGWGCDYDVKMPEVYFWKKEWVARTSREAGVYFGVSDFAPSQYGRSREEHPCLSLRTEDLSRLKIRDGEGFGRETRIALSPELRSKWEAGAGDLDHWPLGVVYRDIDEAQRVHWMAEPGQLVHFLVERLNECEELVPAVNQALTKFGRA